MNNAMTVYDATGDIQVSRPPEQVLEEARRAATVLTAVLKSKPNKVMMNGEQYLEFEDWQTVARFYGLTAKVKETEFLDYGGVKGFLAKAVAVRADGMEISAAEAMCMNDEEKWSSRPKYGYLYVLKDGTKQEEEPPTDQMVWVDNPKKPGKKIPKKERVALGEVCVPLFQLRSMAQTRACAKALRNVLAWVVVLAGYKPTVAEEMTGDEETEPDKPPLKEPGKKPEEKKTDSAGKKTDSTEQDITVILSDVSGRDGEKTVKGKDGKEKKEPYTIYTLTDESGVKYATFSDTFADLARTAKEAGAAVKITFTVGTYGPKITNLAVEEREVGAEG